MTGVKFIDVTDSEAIFDDNRWDAVVVVTHGLDAIAQEELAMLASHGAQVDARVGRSTTLLFAPGLAGGRLIVAPLADSDSDIQDVRVYSDAARQGIKVAFDSGARRPLLIVTPSTQARYQQSLGVAALGCAQALWQALERREAMGEMDKISQIGLLVDDKAGELLSAIEAGKHLARDLCGTEPERMSAPAFAQYCVDAMQGLDLNISVVEDRDVLERDYPLLSAVGRASFAVPRHQPRVVKLEYKAEGPIERSYFFAGKGVVYDTGGADLKVGGAMAGMSRDKGGAAAVAGLMKTLALLKPKGVRVVAELGLVRNSIGSEAFVTDEIITSHAGVRVRIGNTDAEGRLVLADLLSHLRLKAQHAEAPQLFSVATLTGHVVRCYGGYTALVENAVAREQKVGQNLQAISEAWGEPVELSRLRREDYQKIVDPSGVADILSSNNAPSSVTARGHQYPAAFLLKASGLEEHGLTSDKPLAYTHVDIAGSATEGDPLYGTPTAAPLLSLCQLIRS